MKIIHTIEGLREALAPYLSPAFVPTMGNLHDGHLRLVQVAKPLGDVCVASIFVNRLQFAPHEDFDSYPRTLQDDCEKLQNAGCDIVFAPSEAEFYPKTQSFQVVPAPELANILEGQFRPGFFTGVCTVVMKLFQCVFSQAKGPRYAVFGNKDYQQQQIIREMVRQFAMPIEIIGVATERAADGLALSSRNAYLSAEQRLQASELHFALQDLASQVQAVQKNLAHLPSAQQAQHWEQTLEHLQTQAYATLQSKGWQPDYMVVRQRNDLASIALPQSPPTAPLWVALGAAKLGSTRLIDNLEF